MADHPSVLVTGGAGYIGSHGCKALSEAGLTPVCFDNFSTGHPHFLKSGPVIKGDVRNSEEVLQALRQHQVAAVLHFAASSAVGEFVANPEKYYTNNVTGTLSLLRAMREYGCDRLVFSSTGAVYGDGSDRPISETALCEPVNPCGASFRPSHPYISLSRLASRWLDPANQLPQKAVKAAFDNAG